MNKRCVCSTITIIAGGETRVFPEVVDTNCPVHGLRDGVDWAGHPVAGESHPLRKYARDVTISWCYVMLVGRKWIHWESSQTRKETPAEVQRRLYAEAVPA